MRALVSTWLLVIGVAIPAVAQNDRAAVMEPINRFFDAMRAGDSAMARSVFTDDAQLYRAQPNGLSGNSIDGIIRAIGTPHDSVWDEVLWDTQVHIDGHLATVWTKYAFYVGPRFNHCGVDSIQLYRGTEGWKIFWITDTQRREGCEMPPGRR